MRPFLTIAIACGALAGSAALAQADDDWWDDWEDAVEDAQDDAEDQWEREQRQGRGPAGVRHPHRPPGPVYQGQGYGHWHYYGYEPRPMIGVVPPCVWVPVQQPVRQAGHRRHGLWLEDVAWYESDSPAPRPLTVSVPPAPADSGHVYTSTEAAPAPPFVGDPPWPSGTPTRLEPIPDARFRRQQ